jgi:hypothetical protein
MSSKTYVGVTALPRYVIRAQNQGREYYYFRRRPFPIVRLPGERGSMAFTTAYNAALKATSQEEFGALRKSMHRQGPRRPASPTTQAILIWAQRQPITSEQVTLVAHCFGVSIDEITHGREIVSE